LITSKNYRSDIDGLRGIAILWVLLYHAFPTIFSGGFVGVDVFFVISGFVISRIILDDLEQNRFSFKKFYAARVRRIFPSLIAVCAFTLVIACVFLPFNQLSQLASQQFFATLFLGNFFTKNQGYFDDNSQIQPFLHLWSLAVEQQFYLLFPPLIFLAWCKRITPLIVMLLIFALSVFASIIYSNSNSAFFLTQFRICEIMLGGLLVCFEKNKNLEKFRSKNLTYFGLAAIILALFVIDKYTAFPSLFSLLPTLGCAAIIWSANQNKIIANRYLVGLGLISYPLYLWHWPLITLAKLIYGIYLPSYALLFLLVLSILLAWLTFEFIEKPFRFGKKITHKILILSLGLVAVSSASLMVFMHSELSKNFSEQKKFLRNFKDETHNYTEKFFGFNCDFRNRKDLSQKVDNAILAIEESCYKTDLTKTKKLFLWGDCNAQQLRYGLQKNLPPEWQIMQVASSACDPEIIENGDENFDYCKRSNHFALQQIKESKPDVVIIAQYQNHSFDDAKKIAKELKSVGISKILFLGATPHWQISMPDLMITKFANQTSQRSQKYFDKSAIAKNEFLRKKFAANNLNYIDVLSQFCNDEGCLVLIDDWPTAFDNYHLTAVASDCLVRNLIIPKLEN